MKNIVTILILVVFAIAAFIGQIITPGFYLWAVGAFFLALAAVILIYSLITKKP